MSNPLASIASLFNRAPKPSWISISPEKKKEGEDPDPKGKNPSSDPLSSLTAYAIETTHRLSVNRGLYAVPAWTFHELARTCSLLGDKIRFWKAQVAALEWDIVIAKDAQEDAPDADPVKVKLAKDQQKTLLEAYDKIDNFKTALKHLASARFNGYAVLRKTPTMLQIVDPWNVVRDIQWQSDKAPTMKWAWNEQARQMYDATTMPEMTPAEYIVRECEDPSMLELMRLAFRANAVMNFREKNLEEASKNQVIILTGSVTPAEGSEERTALVAALNAARKGESAVIAKGDPACPTEVHKMEAAKGLPFYNSTLDSIDQMMTKAVTGGMLTMISMPTGIGSGASDTQGETLATLVADEASEISETLQRFVDKPILKAAGLLQEGERALAFFQLSSRKKTDPQAGAQLLLTLAQAGKTLDDAQAGEVTGLVFETKEPELMPAQGDLPNRARLSAVADYAQAKKLAAMDAPFFDLIDEITQRVGLDGPPTPEWFDALENAVRTASPELGMDSTALRDYLARVMVKAKEAGERVAPKG